MGIGIDTVVAAATNPGSTGAAATANSGDSLTVRAFPSSADARLTWLARQGATEGFVLVKSPRLHDASRGLQIITVETPSVFIMPYEVSQPMYSADQLTVNVSGGTAEVDAVAFEIYYTDMPGVQARVYTLDQVQAHARNLKPLEVDVSAQGTSANWSDTVLTTTENLLKADTYYAVLGYTVDVACLAVGIKGPETGNLRVCGPGPTSSFPTTDYFARMSMFSKRPYIPVFNANNRAGTFVSTALVSTSATPKVVLNCVELDQSWTP